MRRWLADAALFAFAVGVWLEGTLNFPPEGVDFVHDWMIAVNPWLGALACLAVWGRRRFPQALAIALIPVVLVAASALGAAMVAVFTLAAHRPWPRGAVVCGIYLLLSSYYAFFADPPGLSRPQLVASTALLFIGPFCLGLVVRSRREVLQSLEREHRSRLADTRRAEREQLAREMHDVLAHRISLLSVHAGALAYRTARADPPLEPGELGQAVQVIQDNARLALDELGEVLSVLRADPAVPSKPDLSQLIAEASAAGQTVLLTSAGALDELRPQVQRTAYRVVQEGLTNARKHAPGARVSVHLEAEPEGLTIRIENAGTPSGNEPGYGLVGLSERVALEGGTLEHGFTGGRFLLTARL